MGKSTVQACPGVFSDPEALARLEAIVHPLVRRAVDISSDALSKK
jgi:dephospho-CoA kinase